MDALQGVPAWAGAEEFVQLAIFARRSPGTRAIGLADIVGLRRILRNVVARILAGIGGDRIQLIRLLGVDLLGRALFRAAGQQSQADDSRGKQAGPHLIPLCMGSSRTPEPRFGARHDPPEQSMKMQRTAEKVRRQQQPGDE